MFRSIGYRGTPLEGLPFDERRAVIPNDGGRVIGDDGPLPGEYVVGWIKRGPTGIIGTNKRDAQETVDMVLEDLDAGRLPAPADPDRDSLDALIAERQPDAVSYAGWQAIDEAGALRRRAPRPAAREAVQLRGPARGLEGGPYAGALTLACSPSSASRARSTDERMQVKIGVSEAV